MSSNAPKLAKPLSSSASFPAAQLPAPPSATFDSVPRVRPNQQGPSPAAPRNSQRPRKRHRNQKHHLPFSPLSASRQVPGMPGYGNLNGANRRRNQTDITHLLDFSTPLPYDAYSRSYRRQPTWGPGSGYHAVDKARYVHANYRFVMSPQARYEDEAGNADEHVDWNNVLQIIASEKSQATACPICLSDPVAPRMAKCGHIFCFPCLLRYMNAKSDDEEKSHRKTNWKKCPICHDGIYISDVRPVRFYTGQESSLPRPGEDIILRLMMRHSGSTLALPKEGGAEVLDSVDDVPWHFAAMVLDHARVMKGTTEYMLCQYNGEIEALEKMEMEDEIMFGENNEWTQASIRKINASKETALELDAATDTRQAKASTDRGKSAICDYFFYMATPHVYLSALDIRILKTKYGDFSAFPSTLLPRVEHVSTGHVVDDHLRRRAKYLNHLPRGCLVSFVECDWTDIIPEETLGAFKTDLESRRKRNRAKEAQDEHRRVRAEHLESAETMITRQAAMGDLATANPVLNMNEFQPLGSSVSTSPPTEGSGAESLVGFPTSALRQKTVWGTHVVSGWPSFVEDETSSGLVDDGWLKDDEVLGAAETAMSKQMESLAFNGDSSGSKPEGTKQKKKQKQKITLMSTGSRRMG